MAILLVILCWVSCDEPDIPFRESGNTPVTLCWASCDELTSYPGGVVMLCWVSCDGLTSHPEGVRVFLLTSCGRIWQKLHFNLYATITFTVAALSFANLQCFFFCSSKVYGRFTDASSVVFCGSWHGDTHKVGRFSFYAMSLTACIILCHFGLWDKWWKTLYWPFADWLPCWKSTGLPCGRLRVQTLAGLTLRVFK